MQLQLPWLLFCYWYHYYWYYWTSFFKLLRKPLFKLPIGETYFAWSPFSTKSSSTTFNPKKINYHSKIDVHHHRKITIFIIYKFHIYHKIIKNGNQNWLNIKMPITYNKEFNNKNMLELKLDEHAKDK